MLGSCHVFCPLSKCLLLIALLDKHVLGTTYCAASVKCHWILLLRLPWGSCGLGMWLFGCLELSVVFKCEGAWRCTVLYTGIVIRTQKWGCVMLIDWCRHWWQRFFLIPPLPPFHSSTVFCRLVVVRFCIVDFDKLVQTCVSVLIMYPLLKFCKPMSALTVFSPSTYYLFLAWHMQAYWETQLQLVPVLWRSNLSSFFLTFFLLTDH